MGIWGLPQTNLERKELRAKLKQLKKLQTEISHMFGDDQLLDAFYLANERIKLALKPGGSKTDHREASCIHPAFYGESPGVCSDCRLNLEDSSKVS